MIKVSYIYTDMYTGERTLAYTDATQIPSFYKDEENTDYEGGDPYSNPLIFNINNLIKVGDIYFTKEAHEHNFKPYRDEVLVRYSIIETEYQEDYISTLTINEAYEIIKDLGSELPLEEFRHILNTEGKFNIYEEIYIPAIDETDILCNHIFKIVK